MVPCHRKYKEYYDKIRRATRAGENAGLFIENTKDILTKSGARNAPGSLLGLHIGTAKGILITTNARGAPESLFGNFQLELQMQYYWNPAREARRNCSGSFHGKYKGNSNESRRAKRAGILFGFFAGNANRIQIKSGARNAPEFLWPFH